MTPSNPDNSQPLIYRIADALGVFHLVAPVDHTHLTTEVSGLTEALAAKANAVPAGSPSGGIVIAGTSGELARSNKTVQDLLDALAGKMDKKTIDSTPTANSTNLVTSGGVKAALDGKADQVHTHSAIGDEGSSITVGDGEINIELADPTTHSGGEVNITVSKLPNLQRAINNPDTTPTANSNNLVTSGGVKDAIDNAIAIRYSSAKPLIEDIFGDANLQKVDCCILNSTGSEASITDLFHISVGQTLLLPDNAPTIPNGKMALLHIYRTITQGQFIVSIGGIYTIE